VTTRVIVGGVLFACDQLKTDEMLKQKEKKGSWQAVLEETAKENKKKKNSCSG
jgi:hypothetical protein